MIRVVKTIQPNWYEVLSSGRLSASEQSHSLMREPHPAARSRQRRLGRWRCKRTDSVISTPFW